MEVGMVVKLSYSLKNRRGKMGNIFQACILLIIAYLRLCNGAQNIDIADSKKPSVIIRKLCGLGKVLVHPTFECKEVILGQNWTGFIYDPKTFKRQDSNSFEPSYVFSSKNDKCENGSWSILLNSSPAVATVKTTGDNASLSASSSESDEIQSKFILLSNGKLMWTSDKCTCGKCDQWTPFRPVPFFLDGLGFSIGVGNGSKAHYTGQESHQIIYYCNLHVKQGDSHYDVAIRNDKIFVAVLFITAFIYFITVLIYGVLWKSYTLPGRVMLSVVLSRTVMSFMLGLGYMGKLYRWDVSSNNWCVVIAVFAHYFAISSYSWVTVLNFDLWWTFRTVRPYSDEDGRNRKYFLYSCFGWGLPFLLTGISVVIDSVYKHQPKINHKLVPNYGNGVCFIVDCAYGIYVHTFTALFLLPALVFSIMTFRALYKFQRETAHIRDAKSGEKQSSFQLYLKLLVVMSISWTVGHIVWYFHTENDGSSSYYVRNTILLILHWGIDLLGTSTFILVVFGFSKTNRSKLEQDYVIVHAIFEQYRQLKKVKFANSHVQPMDSSTPLIQMQTQSTSNGGTSTG